MAALFLGAEDTPSRCAAQMQCLRRLAAEHIRARGGLEIAQVQFDVPALSTASVVTCGEPTDAVGKSGASNCGFKDHSLQYAAGDNYRATLANVDRTCTDSESGRSKAQRLWIVVAPTRSRYAARLGLA